MAFSAALRRASPFAIRALRGSLRIHSSAVLCSVPRSSALPREPLAPMARVSSQGKILASDADLLRVIDSEIKCAEDCDDHDRVEEVPEGFPFQIVDKEGNNVITLQRNYRGEAIEVVVSMPSLVTGEKPDRNSDHNDGDGDENVSQSSIPLSVTLSKAQGPSLEFICTAYPDELTIESMTVSKKKESDADEELIAYEGPNFEDLDENLQKAFHKYLEIRGISPMTTNFLHEYMINKDSREYLIWLKKFSAFIGKTC